jgi:ureidoacrylate peracid hydrolase
MSTKALICVDFEKEWTDKSSDYFVGDISDVVERTNRLIDFCRKQGFKIIFTTHIEKDSDSAFAEDSQNVDIIDELHKRDSDVLIKKNKISPFFKTNLEKELESIKEIVICGILTNLCVRSLAQDAYDRDFEIKIIKDCCKAFDDATHEFTIRDLKATRQEIEFLDQAEFTS